MRCRGRAGSSIQIYAFFFAFKNKYRTHAAVTGVVNVIKFIIHQESVTPYTVCHHYIPFAVVSEGRVVLLAKKDELVYSYILLKVHVSHKERY